MEEKVLSFAKVVVVVVYVNIAVGFLCFLYLLLSLNFEALVNYLFYCFVDCFDLVDFYVDKHFLECILEEEEEVGVEYKERANGNEK